MFLSVTVSLCVCICEQCSKEAWESLGVPSGFPRGMMEGQSGEPAASHPTQKQLSLGLFYILRFHTTHQLTKEFFCLSGKKV